MCIFFILLSLVVHIARPSTLILGEPPGSRLLYSWFPREPGVLRRQLVHAFKVLSDVREPGVLRRNTKVVEFRKGKPSYTREEKNSGKTDMHAEKRRGMNA
jgi:hypothetical protein